MINFSGVDNRPWYSRLLRFALGFLPANMTMRIWQGTLCGKKWIVGSFTHGCWLGSYECQKQRIIADVIKPGTVFFDVGAHVGFYTLLASALVEDRGRVIAFEPLPRNIEYFEKHIALNKVQNVMLIKAAVSDQPGEMRFQEGQASSMGRISENGTHVVEMVSLDDLVSRHAIPFPDYMKIDVEGAELFVLEGARQILRERQMTIFLATHGSDVHGKCLLLLQSLGYSCRSLDENKDLESCDEVIASNHGM